MSSLVTIKYQKSWARLVSQTNKLANYFLFSGANSQELFLLSKEYIKYIIQANQDLAKRIDNESFLDLKIINKNEHEEITINDIREINSFLQQTAKERDHKFLIINHAHNLNLNAANSLLKILEEPAANSYFFLLTTNPNKILVTVKSRSRLHHFIKNKQQFDDKIKEVNMAIYEELLKIFINKDHDLKRFFVQIKQFSDQETLAIVDFFFNRLLKFSAIGLQNQDDFSNLEQEILPKIIKNNSQEKLFECYFTYQQLAKNCLIFNASIEQLVLIIMQRLSLNQ